MSEHLIPSLDSSEGAPEYVRVEHAALDVVYISVMKDGQEVGVYVERAELARALEPPA